MKNVFLLASVFFFGLVACSQAQKSPEPRKSPHDTVTANNVKVTYGRPYKKGRDIFGSLIPFGQVYRCGADEATEITFGKDATFAGKSVKAGTYTLFVIPNEKQWTIILNSQLKQWGAYSYDKNKDKDVLHADVPVKMLGAPVEQLTIGFTDKNMIIEWDKTQVNVPVSL